MIYDVLVVGGGPAGSATALRLAQLGKRVALCERAIGEAQASAARSPRIRVGECLPAAVGPLLDVLGVRDDALAAGFVPVRAATVAWAGETTRSELHVGPSMLVDRAAFDAALFRAASAREGVTTFHPARVVRAMRGRGSIDGAPGAADEGAWEVLIEDGRRLRATLLVEATGRAHLLPRRRRALGARTLAMFAYFRDDTEGSDGGTLVESGHDAWYWAGRLPTGELNATVFVDPGGARSYEDWLRASSLLAPRLQGARRVRGPFVRDATAYADDAAVGEGFLKVGDAALCLDPLSSQGMETAIGTALHAAVVLNTVLERPGSAALAADFYRARLESTAAFHARAAADFYAREAVVNGARFWRTRAPRAHLSRPAHAAPSPGSWIIPSPRLRFVTVPVATATHVVPVNGVELGSERYAFVDRDLAVAPLLRTIARPCRGLDVVRAWSREMAPERALRVLLWACSEGLVEARAAPLAG